MSVSLPCGAELENSIAAPRRGRIVVQNGLLSRVERLWFPRRSTISRVWFDTHFRRGGAPDMCSLIYRGTRATPGYLAVEYARSGPRTGFASIRGVLAVLDQIARRRQCVAIVAHVSTWAISDRVLERFGWELQATRAGGGLSGRHWIKRFYDGYPEHDLARYCRTSPARINR